jgi:hypothetical protein
MQPHFPARPENSWEGLGTCGIGKKRTLKQTSLGWKDVTPVPEGIKIRAACRKLALHIARGKDFKHMRRIYFKRISQHIARQEILHDMTIPRVRCLCGDYANYTMKFPCMCTPVTIPIHNPIRDPPMVMLPSHCFLPSFQ